MATAVVIPASRAGRGSVRLTLSDTEQLVAEAAGSVAEARLEAAIRAEILRGLLAAQEAERSRVARDLHDQIGQMLTFLGYAIGLVERGIKDGAEPAVLGEQLEEMRGLTRSAIDEVRRIAFALRPSTLDNIGLDAALRRYIREWSGATEIPARLSIRGELGILSDDVRTAMYRVVQEALTNVARHARATSVRVTIVRNADGLRCAIRDNGTGFNVPHADDPLIGSTGLWGMAERVRLTGGRFKVQSRPGAGTTIRIEVPL
jgi:signal transduction histidine kinase